jgi:2-dehydropantoate 2-reductase
MKIAVMGTGGLGGYYGGLIAKAGFDVSFIARGEHLKAIQQNGLKVVSVQGEFLVPVKATSEPSEVGPVDLVLFCVKSYDTEVAARSALPLVAGGGSVLTIQNGIDNHERIRATIGNANVLPGAAFIASEIAKPGIIQQSAGPRKIVFGEVDGKRTERAEQIHEVMSSAGINCELSDNISKVLWEKFIWICGMAGANCLTRLPMGEIVRTPETREMFREIMEEVTKVAQAVGVSIKDDYVNQQMDFADHLEKNATSSMFRDLMASKRLELQALHGTVVRLGNEHGIPTPTNKIVYAALKPYEKGRAGPVGIDR